MIETQHTFQQQRQKTYLQHARNKDPDHPAHSRGLDRIFTERTLDSQGQNACPCGHRIF